MVRLPAWKGRSRLVVALVLLTGASTITAAAAGNGTGQRRASSSASPKVDSRAVTFKVRNTNTSMLKCASDGAAYEVKGHLVAPWSGKASSSARRRGVALYLHGLGFGEWLWNFTAVPGRNYAVAQAKAGHASVVIDRLGYGASGRPSGNGICLGAHADVAHQVIGQLRSGAYSVERGKAARFTKVGLVGHSIAGEIAMIEAYSFSDVDALTIVAYSSQSSPRAVAAFGKQNVFCQAGGEPAGPGGPPAYSYYGDPAPDAFRAANFDSAGQAVIQAAIKLRSRDPCGDNASTIPALVQQKSLVKKIKVPVLLICGRDDVLFAGPACDGQKDRFTASKSRSLVLVPNAGHAITLEQSAPIFRRKLSTWLEQRGL